MWGTGWGEGGGRDGDASVVGWGESMAMWLGFRLAAWLIRGGVVDATFQGGAGRGSS